MRTRKCRAGVAAPNAASKAKTHEPRYAASRREIKVPAGSKVPEENYCSPATSLKIVHKWAGLAGVYAPAALREVKANTYTDRAAVREVTQTIQKLLTTWAKVEARLKRDQSIDTVRGAR
jgi:hypothetical protein